MTPHNLTGLRVLIVDDEALIADFLQIILEEAGCSVVGHVGTVAKAIAAIEQGQLDGVVLDANLHGVSTAPVADLLEHRGVPFVVATGYLEIEFASAAMNNAPRLTKPFDEAQFRKVVAATFGR